MRMSFRENNENENENQLYFLKLILILILILLYTRSKWTTNPQVQNLLPA